MSIASATLTSPLVWDGNYGLNPTERLGVEDKDDMVRHGLAHYNTAEEVDGLLEELETIAA